MVLSRTPIAVVVVLAVSVIVGACVSFESGTRSWERARQDALDGLHEGADLGKDYILRAVPALATPRGFKLKALEILGAFGEEGETASEWLAKFQEETDKSASTFYRCLGNLEEDEYVTRPGESDKGERYILTEKGREAVTVK